VIGEIFGVEGVIILGIALVFLVIDCWCHFQTGGCACWGRINMVV
jgi:hypothetical protein